MNHFKLLILTNLVLLLIISTSSNAQEIGGPYTTDANTILLMHFDGDLSNNSALSGNGMPLGSGISYSSNSPTNFDQCLNLDGSSYVTFPHNVNLNLGGDWTIEAWIKITAFNSSTQSIIVRKPGDSDDYNANYNFELHPWWGNVLNGFYFSNDSTRINVTDISPTLNQWYHVAFIKDVSNSKISIIVHDENGNQVSSSSQNYFGNDVLLSSKDLRIGEKFDGFIDELRISNVVRSFTPPPPPPFPAELDQVRIEKKINALNLHPTKFHESPFNLTIDVLSSTEYEAQKPSESLPFDCGFVNNDGWVYVSEPSTAEQLEVFSDIDQAAIYYMCQSFLQYYYQETEMPIWFKTGFAAFESDMRFDDNDIKTAYNNYSGALTSFDVLNQPVTFASNNGLAISYMFCEFIGVFKGWGYNMVKDVNASTITPESSWYNAGTIQDLFDYFIRYFNARIFETNESERLKLGKETEHFKHYNREAEDYWLAYFPDILEEAITEYIGLMDFEPYEKFSSLTMPICNYALIGGGDCVDLRYTSGTAWSSGIWSSSPDTDNPDDIERFKHLIRHELAHLVQAQIGASNSTMTAWLNEGFAEFMSRGPSNPEEKIALKSWTEMTLNDAINYFGHLPTFEDTRVYPGQTTVDYYLLGQIMQNFIYERGGYSAVREVIIDPESGIINMGFSTQEAFMASYYHYVDVEYLQKDEADYFANYDKFITKLTNLTSSADSTAKLNTFWDNLIATGNFPFAIDTKVAFLYRGSANKINWAGEFNNWDMNSDGGFRLGLSNIWLLEKDFPADARSGYKIIKNGSEWLADPYNPYPLTSEFGNSELRMPEYVIPPETIPRYGIVKGTLTDNILKFSTNLNYTSQYRVYTPAGYSALSNLPTIYVTDGQSYLDDSMGKMVIVLDNLIADEIIEPVIAVFLDPRDPNNLINDRRGNEYRNNINFVNYLIKELIPDIDATYKTNSSADARGMMGASWGGYNAAYFCVKANDYFHMIGMNSAYLHPEGNYSIDTDLQATNLDGMKLYLSYGTFDVQGEQYFYRLKNIFDQKGNDYEYNIIGDGHTWENWSRVVGKALEYFFSDTENSPPVVANFSNQTILEGNSFATIQLDNFVTDIDNTDSQIVWTYSGNDKLSIEIDVNRVAIIRIPDENWYGREVITFIATDPSNASASKDATFLVIPVNDYPIISGAPELIEFVSDTSYTIDIWNLISDIETSDDLLINKFSIDSDSIHYSYDDGTGILILSAEIEFGGEGIMSWSVSDSDASVADTIHISVEKAIIIEVDDELIIPEKYVLHQNYPNPFNPSTMIKYGVPEQSNIRIEIFNMLGQSVYLLVNSEKSAGYYKSIWNAANLPSGIYLISIEANGLNSKHNFTQIKKALLLK